MSGKRRGLIPLLLVALALLLQVNAPVARAAASGPAFCHDLRLGAQTPHPGTPDQDPCAACLVCCSAAAAMLPDAPVLIARATPSPAAQPRPELAPLRVRGPPHLRPPATGPPAPLA